MTENQLQVVKKIFNYLTNFQGSEYSKESLIDEMKIAFQKPLNEVLEEDFCIPEKLITMSEEKKFKNIFLNLLIQKEIIYCCDWKEIPSEIFHDISNTYKALLNNFEVPDYTEQRKQTFSTVHSLFLCANFFKKEKVALKRILIDGDTYYLIAYPNKFNKKCEKEFNKIGFNFINIDPDYNSVSAIISNDIQSTFKEHLITKKFITELCELLNESSRCETIWSTLLEVKKNPEKYFESILPFIREFWYGSYKDLTSTFSMQYYALRYILVNELGLLWPMSNPPKNPRSGDYIDFINQYCHRENQVCRIKCNEMEVGLNRFSARIIFNELLIYINSQLAINNNELLMLNLQGGLTIFQQNFIVIIPIGKRDDFLKLFSIIGYKQTNL